MLEQDQAAESLGFSSPDCANKHAPKGPGQLLSIGSHEDVGSRCQGSLSWTRTGLGLRLEEGSGTVQDCAANEGGGYCCSTSQETEGRLACTRAGGFKLNRTDILAR